MALAGWSVYGALAFKNGGYRLVEFALELTMHLFHRVIKHQGIYF